MYARLLLQFRRFSSHLIRSDRCLTPKKIPPVEYAHHRYRFVAKILALVFQREIPRKGHKIPHSLSRRHREICAGWPFDDVQGPVRTALTNLKNMQKE